jgi:signal transduction histidine kinase
MVNLTINEKNDLYIVFLRNFITGYVFTKRRRDCARHGAAVIPLSFRRMETSSFKKANRFPTFVGDTFVVKSKRTYSEQSRQAMTSLRNIWKRSQGLLKSPESRAVLWFFVTLTALMLLWWQAGSWYRLQLLAGQRAQVTEEVALRGSALSASFNRRFALLRGLHAFVRTEADQDDFGTRFQIFAANLYANTSGIYNIATAPDGIIRYIYPPEGNEKILGYDLLHTLSPDLQEDIQLAMETEEIILGFPLDYAQEGWGLAARKAVYLDDGSFWGLISIVIDIPTLLRDAGLESESSDLDFRLVDRSDEVIYETGPILGKAGVTYKLGLPEEPWVLCGYPKEDWDAIIRPDLLPIQISGMAIVLLLSGLVYVSVNRQARLAKAVQQRTREIAQINRSLEQRVAARTRELTTLLEVSQNVASIPDVQPLLSLIQDRLQSIVSCVAIAIFLLEDEHNLTLLTYRGPIAWEDLPTLWPLAHADHYQEVIQNRATVIISDVRADSRLASAWRQTIKQQLGEIPDYILSWMGVPLLVKRRVVGLLVFHHDQANFYTNEQATIATAFAQQAALAIENARLYEQTQQVAILRERQRLARELHDSVSQALYSISLGARTAQTLVERNTHGEIKSVLSEPIAHVLAMAEAGLVEMRALIFELRPESLENEGLIAALTKQTAAIQARHGLDMQVILCDEPEIALDIKLILYRLAQEALHNIVKHAEAHKVDFELACNDNWINLKIRDDGKGFDAMIPSQGLGLRSMQERIAQVNGQLEVISSPGTGTMISAQIPIGCTS